MTRRRRIARLLDRLGAWVFGPGVAECAELTQERLDALIAQRAVEDR